MPIDNLDHIQKAATGIMATKDNDAYAARRTADQILSILRPFIPDHCYRDAWERMVDQAHEQGFELTNRLVRKEYEAIKQTVLDMGNFKP